MLADMMCAVYFLEYTYGRETVRYLPGSLVYNAKPGKALMSSTSPSSKVTEAVYQLLSGHLADS